MDPIKTNVHGFVHLLPNALVVYSNSCSNIYLDGGGWLGITHFGEDCSDGNSGLANEGESAIFGFSS